MLSGYLPIGLLIVVAVAFAFALLIFSAIFGPRKPNSVKASPYESGMVPSSEPRIRLHVKYYLMAIIFLAFDVEVTFLYPWAVVYTNSFEKGKGIFFLAEMMFFFTILFIGYIYGWKKGAYDWD